MKYGKYARFYSLATQGIFSMVVFTAIGFFIGWKINPSSPWPAILAVIGVLLGLIIFITNLLIILKEQEKERKKEDASKE